MRKSFIAVLVILSMAARWPMEAQVHRLSLDMVDTLGRLDLPDMTLWEYLDPSRIERDVFEVEDNQWRNLTHEQINQLTYNDNLRFEAWFRIELVFDSSLVNLPLSMFQRNTAATNIYLNGQKIHEFGHLGLQNSFKEHNPSITVPVPIRPKFETKSTLTVHMISEISPLASYFEAVPLTTNPLIVFTTIQNMNQWKQRDLGLAGTMGGILSITFFLSSLFWMLYIFNSSEKPLLLIAIIMTCTFAVPLCNSLSVFLGSSTAEIFWSNIVLVFLLGIFVGLPLLLTSVLYERTPQWVRMFSILAVVGLISTFIIKAPIPVLIGVLSLLICMYLIGRKWQSVKGAQWALIMGVLLLSIMMVFIGLIFILELFGPSMNKYRPVIFTMAYMILPISLLVYAVMWYREMMEEIRTNADKLIRASEEKRELLANQNNMLEEQVSIRTKELNESLKNLKETQSQLILNEKMASLGEMTAGIAHEIQNPLNFVNNFSELNEELIDELKEEVSAGNLEEVSALVNDLKLNESKIKHHGKRAESIVKNMLMHSRNQSGAKELININSLCDEYIRLAYHGMKAKDKSFEARFETSLDPQVEEISVIPQDMSRVLLNLLNNAFQAVDEKRKLLDNDEKDVYEPRVQLKTYLLKDKKQDSQSLEISVRDNGSGIPKENLDKVFQPFFTTKPTGMGTGLGLSLAYDIVTKGHGGEISIDSDGNGTVVILRLPY